MFRSVSIALRTLPLRSPIIRTPAFCVQRNFSSSIVTFKKAAKPSKSSSSKKGGKQPVEEEESLTEEDPSVVLKSLETKYKDSLKHFKETLNETKLGNANPKIFDHLEITLDHKETANFLSVAQTSLKGRNLIITVFDPIYSKHVISAVLASGLNLNPEPVLNIPQQLKVTLPPPTAEHRKEVAKELKKNFEHFKNSNGFKHSLSAKRAEAIKELKAFKKNDAIKKVNEDVEKLHKKYTNELQDLYKAAEKAVLN